MSPARRRSLTVIVPLHDEAPGVPALAARLRRWLADEVEPRAVDLVLVDDGSQDDTWPLLQRHCADLPVQLLRHDHNRGLTAALATGLSAARGESIAWLDSDLTYDPAVLGALAEEVDAGADVALASCYHPNGAVEGVPRWRLALSSAASRIYRVVTRADLHTFTCMVRVYRCDVARQCASPEHGFLGVTDTLLRALHAGCVVREVPAVLSRRRVGQSKMRVVRVGLGHLRMIARTAVRRRGGRQSCLAFSAR